MNLDQFTGFKDTLSNYIGFAGLQFSCIDRIHKDLILRGSLGTIIFIAMTTIRVQYRIN